MDFEIGMDTTSKVLMALALGGLAVSGLCFLAAFAAPYVKATWDRASKFARAVFCGAAVGAVLFGGAKNGATGKITYPKTDNEIAYLTDAGSYVTNDAVHVAFTRLPMVPDTATFYLDYCALDGTNEQGVATNWVNAKTATFGELSVPFDFAFANATNYNWLAYTDWTPGPAVQTNGVWHAYWGVDKKQGRYFIPVRTCVRDGGSVIATPKSKWDAATRTPDDYVQDGLVAMWDGEWNAGRGVHDPNATAWVDLIGGLKITTRYPFGQVVEKEKNGTNYTSRIYFSDNAVICEMMNGWTTGLGSDNYAVVPKELYSFFELTNLTVEAVVNKNDIGGPAFDSGFQNRSAYSIIGSLGSLGIGDIPWFRQSPTRFYPVGCTESKRNYTITILTHDWDWATYGADGELLKDIQGTRSSNYKTANILYTGWYGTLGQVISYNWRLYNRALTAEEIAHNYEIDKARFGSDNE